MQDLPMKCLFPIWGVLIFLCLPSTCLGFNKAEADKSRQGSVSKHIQYSFTLQNRSGQMLEQADFWTYAPLQKSSVQKVTKLEASDPFERIEDELGNQILHFSFTQFPPFATKIITIKADLVFYQDKEKLADNLRKIFLGPEEYIESRHPKIIQQANQLRGTTDLKTATNIFNWVEGHIEYAGYVEQRQGALYALEKNRGDCTEFMDLFIALTRATDIPARGIAGYVVQENGVLTPLDFHNWAEFFENSTWNIADPQKKVFMRNQSDYIAMRIIGPTSNNPMGDYNRFKFEGDGLSVKMNH